MSNGNEKLGQGVKFERIRRITGYLVGTMNKWNNAKKAEERDRVKHSLKKNSL
jgi:ribonucleoside-triphosphate reductase